MKIDHKNIVARVKQAKTKKRKVSLYLSDVAYETFKTDCKKLEVGPSEIVEELILAFSESVRPSAKR